MVVRPFYNVEIILELPLAFTLLAGGHVLLMFHHMPKVIWKQFQDNYFMFIYICNFIFSKLSNQGLIIVKNMNTLPLCSDSNIF